MDIVTLCATIWNYSVLHNAQLKNLGCIIFDSLSKCKIDTFCQVERSDTVSVDKSHRKDDFVQCRIGHHCASKRCFFSVAFCSFTILTQYTIYDCLFYECTV